MENVDLGFILSHWPFFVVALGLGLTGEIVKAIVRDYEKATKAVATPTQRALLGLYHRTMPAHAALIGALIGCLPSMPCPDEFCVNATMKMLYYCAAGMFSSWVYDAARHMARSKIAPTDAP